MKNKKYKDCFLNLEGLGAAAMEEWYVKKMEMLDKRIEMYNNRFMSNSKWKKLFFTIFMNSDL